MGTPVRTTVKLPYTHRHYRYTHRELERLKCQFSKHLRYLNALRFLYTDWFERRHKTFSELITLGHVKVPHIVPARFDCVRSFRQSCESLSKVSRSALSFEKCLGIMNELMQFWHRFMSLNQQGRSLHKKLSDFCQGVSELRDQRLKSQVDVLQERLNREVSEDFDFSKVHNERDNLFTYKMSLPNQCFHGLFSLIPYLLKMATSICYLSCKIYLEKV
ncbi:hypothetical protein Btru_078120 [Bulinus truncatus]|nr:hypothetical protein Btru_078120 [Bulinus truncatus]